MTPLEKILAIVLILAGIFGILATIQPIIDLLQNPEIQENKTLQLIGAVSVLSILILINVVLAIMIGKIGLILFQQFKKAEFNIIISKDSKKYVGGMLFFDATITGFFLNGFFNIKIRSIYDDEHKETSRYDKERKLGNLQGNFNNYSLKLKCPIPANFSDGEINIKIELCDVMSWFIFFKTTNVRKTQRLTTSITIPQD